MGIVERTRRRCVELGYEYPPAYVLLSFSGLLCPAIAGWLQRGGPDAPWHSWLAAGFMMWPPIGFFVMYGKADKRMLAFWVLLGEGLFLLDPVSGDLSTIALITLSIMVAASSSLRLSGPVAALSAAMVLAAGLDDRLEHPEFELAAIAFAFIVGCMLEARQRLLQAEQRAQAARSAEAAIEERRRIAREVHDVIAHSLSITLLHLTGARRALEEDRDVDDAIDALADAERLGRQAMADIRRTVGLLAKGPSPVEPEPGVDDIADLIADCRRAGLPVEYRKVGDLAGVSAATGLGAYRITQESLANVVKHSSGTAASVTLHVDEGGISVSIVNDLAAPVAPPVDGHGSGIAGMRQRAELLGGHLDAGPDNLGWRVRATFPAEPGGKCRLLGRRDTRTETAAPEPTTERIETV